jgi:hypothetical protein
MRLPLLLLAVAAAAAAAPLASLSGTIVDARDGKPLQGAKVELYYSKAPQTTGTDGRFEFANLEPGSFTISVEHPGHAKQKTPASRLAPGQNIPNYAIRLEPEAILSGRATGATGTASFTLTDANSNVFIATQYNRDNRFEFRGLPAGRYKLAAEALNQPKTYFPSTLSGDLAEPIELAPGAHREGLEIRLITQTLYPIRGRFTGQIPPGARVNVAAEARAQNGGGRLPSALLAEDGRFEIQAAPGDYRLKVTEIPNSSGQRPKVLGLRDITLTPAPLTDIAIPPSQIRSVRARFRTPAPNASVTLNPTAGLGILQWGNRQPDGTLLTEQLSPDIYAILIGGLPPNTYVRAILANGADITAAGLDLITGTATDLEIVLATDGATLSGQIPANSGTIILARPNAPRPLRELHLYQTTVNASGQFTIPAIAPGDYEIFYRGAANKSLRLDSLTATPRAQIQRNLQLP